MERSRGTSFNQQEDELLCHVYLEVSQDPITSNNQTFKTLWDKITKSYNAKKKRWEVRRKRSLRVEWILFYMLLET
ncbi:hypothetical protein F2Q68_00016251 [Brassica cretica]|uniref:Myb/SANT-like domain-containing protein n=2 Tax=Brassica cretica TaxID=69181 RepID=A0ABQ7F0A5_BRACR|nr:hypothetical protein F2Q68_00016251 [Brassica cretica]KAF3608763.1 hypothetical protein DY000_02048706 [Brassica cretica]